jgi:hypothetical protein
MFLSLFAIDSVFSNGPPLVIDPTYGKLVWESSDGKVVMYRIVDHVEGLTIICYPLVGQLHGKTVSNFCIYKPATIHDVLEGFK